MKPEQPHTHRDQLLKRWLSGDATSRDERELTGLAQDDPFLAEAMEGYQTMPEGEHAEAVTKLKARLRNRAERRGRGAVFYLLRVAAVGAVLLAAWLVFQEFDGQGDAGVAVTQTEEAPSDLEKIEPIKEEGRKEEISSLSQDQSMADETSEETEIPNPMKEVVEKKRVDEPNLEAQKEATAQVEKDQSKKIEEPQIERESRAASKNKRAAAEPKPAPVESDDVAMPSTTVDLLNEPIPPYEEQALPESSAPMVHKIVGKVTNDFGDPLTGASVVVVESESGTVTDSNGYFAIETEANQPNIRISHLGYEDQSFAVRTEDFVNVQLEETEAILDEVKITSTERKADSSYELPLPEGGFSKFEKYIRKNIRRPDGDVTGEVRLRFSFNENSKPTDFEILESLGEAYDEEAKRLLREGPKWTGNTSEKVTYSIKF